MIAAVKGTVIEAVLYEGYGERGYPKWFNDILWKEVIIDNHGKSAIVLTDETDDTFKSVTLLPNHTVVLRNRHGDIYYTDYNVLKTQYNDMGKWHVAHKSDCVECFIFEDSTVTSEIPNWLSDMVHDGYVVMDKNVVKMPNVEIHSDLADVVEMVPPCVFIRNYLGDVKYLDLDMFNTYFETSYYRY